MGALFFIILIFLLRNFVFTNFSISVFLIDRPRLRLGTWEKANEVCSRTDFGDIVGIRNHRMKSCYLSYGLWFGLKKRVPTKIELCESANINGSSFQNVSCARKLLPVCVKNNGKKAS